MLDLVVAISISLMSPTINEVLHGVSVGVGVIVGVGLGLSMRCRMPSIDPA